METKTLDIQCPTCSRQNYYILEQDWLGELMLLLVCRDCDEIWDIRGREIVHLEESTKQEIRKMSSYQLYKLEYDIANLYIDKGLSDKEIGKIYGGLCESIVAWKRRDLGIPDKIG